MADGRDQRDHAVGGGAHHGGQVGQRRLERGVGILTGIAAYFCGLSDPILWGTLVFVNLQAAFLSPPVAMSAYYLKGVAPQWELGDIYHGMFQFMVLQLIGLGLCIAFPEISLWLPRYVFGK